MKNSKTPRSKKIEKNRSLGTGGRGRLSKCKALFFKGGGGSWKNTQKKI
nr:MAG TPA: smart chimeric peptide G6 peptide, Lipopolysaccharide, LBP14, Antibacterial [Caudoviricetes sp.]DAX29662.1 MAG TPA: smart chimeric peptide G6 peptide, Lipopolysaccharide, LBP14, Antibacterial [Caudoviricetes sp.]